MKHTKYIVYNPQTGLNTEVSTEAEAAVLFWRYALKHVLPFFHNTVYTVVEVDEDGMEVCRPSDGSTMHLALNKDEFAQAMVDCISDAQQKQGLLE